MELTYGLTYGLKVLILTTFPPYFLQFSGKELLSSNNDGNMVFLLNHFDPGTRDFCLQIVAAFNWNKFIVLSMEHSNVALEVFSDCIHVRVKLASGAAEDVVQRMPCSVMRMQEETLQQECPNPA